MLEIIRVLDPDSCNTVKFLERFDHLGQTCLAFEMLDGNLEDFLQERGWKPVSTKEIRPIAKQVRKTGVKQKQCFVILLNFYSSVARSLT